MLWNTEARPWTWFCRGVELSQLLPSHLSSDWKSAQEAKAARMGGLIPIKGSSTYSASRCESVEEPQVAHYSKRGDESSHSLKGLTVMRLSQKSIEAKLYILWISFPPRAYGPSFRTWWHPGIDNYTVAPNRWKAREQQELKQTQLRLKSRNSKDTLTLKLIDLLPAVILNRNLYLLLFLLFLHLLLPPTKLSCV